MNGTVRKDPKTGRWYPDINLGMHPAQKCEVCHRLFWVKGKPKDVCPKGHPLSSPVKKPKRVWLKSYRLKSEAQAHLAEVLGNQKAGYVERSHQTVADWLMEWADGLAASDKAPSTIASYRMIVEFHFLQADWADAPLQELTPDALAEYFAAKAVDGMTAATRLALYRVLHKSLSDAVKRRRIPLNPADMIDRPKPTRYRHKKWTGEQLRTFIDSVPGDRLYPLWVVLTQTGMRRGEALGLRWDAVDFDTGYIAILRTVGQVRSEVIHRETAKVDTPRAVFVGPRVMAVLRQWKATQNEERMALGAGWKDTLGLVFTHADGSLVLPDYVSKVFRKRAEAAGLPLIRLHDLRHSHASVLLAKGTHPKVVQERLGHSTIKLTMDTYSHSIPALDEEAAAIAADTIFGAEDGR